MRLSGRQRVVILATATMPVLVHLIGVRLCLDLVIIAYVACGLIIAPILSSAMSHERTTTERLVDDKVSQRSEDLEDAQEDYRQRADDLEAAMRTAFAELDVVPPPLPVRARGRIASGEPRLTACGMTEKGGSRMARFWRCVRKVVYG